MAHKKFGGWIIDKKLFFQLKVANELWYYERRGGTEERQTHLFFVGWYGKPNYKAKLLTINILWVSVQLGLCT